MLQNERLIKIAGMIRKGDTVADIGTDHAYLPVFLIKEGISKKVFACDVANGPLENARLNIKKSGAKEIELRKGNGLEAVQPCEADTFVIAGMGGELIADILTASPWIKNERYELILQPMTSAEELREYLLTNGFSILNERAVNSIGRIYTVIKAKFTGEVTFPKPLFYYFGKLTENPSKDEFIYIKRKHRIIKKLGSDIAKIPSKRDEFLRIETAIKEIESLLEKWELTDCF